MKTLGLSVANAMGRAIAQFRPLVLAYHGVEDPETFEQHMVRLKALRTVLSVEEFSSILETGGRLPKRVAVVTFDDGDRSLVEDGAPILSSLGLPATCFVITDLIETETPFWWREALWLSGHGGRTSTSNASGVELVRALKLMPNDDRLSALDQLRTTATEQAPRQRQLCTTELRQLVDYGVSVGSHTASHPCLDQCDPETVREELCRSFGYLSGVTGDDPVAFAYPNGNVTASVAEIAHSVGYRIAFAFDHRFVRRTVDPMLVPRIRVDSTTSMERFELLVSGLHPLQHRLRGRR